MRRFKPAHLDAEVYKTTYWQRVTDHGVIRMWGNMEARKVLYEPGNGTAYTAVAMRYRLGSCGGLGSVDDGWVVVSGLSCKGYLFQKNGGPLVDVYVREKLGGLDGDYPYFGDIVRTLVDRPGSENVRQLLVIDPEEAL